MKVTAKDLRFNVKELLQAVINGEEVTVTYRGHPCARLLPYHQKKRPDKKSAITETSLFGIWNDYAETENVGAYVRGLRKGRSL